MSAIMMYFWSCIEIIHEGRINDKDMACRAQLRITLQTQICTDCQCIFFCHILFVPNNLDFFESCLHWLFIVREVIDWATKNCLAIAKNCMLLVLSIIHKFNQDTFLIMSLNKLSNGQQHINKLFRHIVCHYSLNFKLLLKVS